MASHNRSQSHGRKQLPAHARPSKPPPLHRSRHSYNHHAHGHSSNSHAARPGGGLNKRHSSAVVPQRPKQEEVDDDDDDDMASFLQFCTTCEKQIVTPDNTVLYCSESCRRKDGSKPAHNTFQSPPITPSSLADSTSSYFDIPATDIMPQRSPTVIRPPSEAFSELNLSHPNSPSEPEQHHNRPRAAFARRDSEAANYLAQFHAAASLHTSSTNRQPHNRNHRHSPSDTTSNLPSLIHSPSSSIGTVASYTSITAVPTSTTNTTANTTAAKVTTANTPRPHLPSRANPLYSSFHSGNKSVDLVNPFAFNNSSTSTSATGGKAEAADKDADGDGDGASLKSGASVRTAFRVVEGEGMSWGGSSGREEGEGNGHGRVGEGCEGGLREGKRGTGVLKNLFGEGIRGGCA